jgi:catechol 2,3-dioxygenase-like lactoylglutathione lyase family enzyme
MKYICPLIVVEDIERSRNLYEKILGQKIKEDYGDNIVFHGDFAIHRRDHFTEITGGLAVTQRSHSFELYFEEDDVDDMAARLKFHGMEFIHGVMEQPWKQRVLRFYDYDLNIIEIGETLEHTAWRLGKRGYSLNEICGITHLDEETVRKAIDSF